MKTQWMTAAAVAMSIVVSGVASAQEKDRVASAESDRSERTAPVKNAVELTIGTVYTQGFGDIASKQPKLTDLATAGGSVQGGVGYRILPQLTLGVYGSWAMFGRGDQANPTGHVYSSTAGVQADWHFLPVGQEFDPWVSLGTGWRGYWMTADQGTTSMQGMELAKLQVGVDYRLDRQIAISPVVGVDLSSFFTQSTPETDSFHPISKPNVNTFLFAGLQGRFDIPTGNASQIASR
jgi:hypothetical protein